MLTDDGLTAFMTLLFLPLLLPCQIYTEYQLARAKEEYLIMKETQWIRDMEFKAARISVREAIAAQDRHAGTNYLYVMDSVVREMAQQANDHLALATSNPIEQFEPVRFATLEEIYDGLYEPSFREFQNKQRPCRRYDGTYLQSIREGRLQESRNKQQSKNSKSRKTAEAIEIVFGIGDMDNTGYNHAFKDAKQSELLLKEFCDHLMGDPHLCFVTTKELKNPNWTPPFRNGLIVLNLNVHCDEATPGVHLTCIPYSRGCKRGPDVQASLGRAMAGMGYPSTWKDVLDAKGERIPKRDKKGNIIHNTDGTVRYQLEPDGQGIIDWIEEQKKWIQKEMLERYLWGREYKGSHPRGNLSVPDYKVARAKERQEEIVKATEKHVFECLKTIGTIKTVLETSVSSAFEQGSEGDIIMKYLQMCPEEEYLEILSRAEEYLARLPAREQNAAKQSFDLLLGNAVKKRLGKNSDKSDRNQIIKTKEDNEIG